MYLGLGSWVTRGDQLNVGSWLSWEEGDRRTNLAATLVLAVPCPSLLEAFFELSLSFFSVPAVGEDQRWCLFTPKYSRP